MTPLAKPGTRGAPRHRRHICLVMLNERTGYRLRRPRAEVRRREAKLFVAVFLRLDTFAALRAALFLVAPLWGAGFLAMTLRAAVLVALRFLPALTLLRALRFGPATVFTVRIGRAACRRRLTAVLRLRRALRPSSFATRLPAIFRREQPFPDPIHKHHYRQAKHSLLPS